MNFQETKVMILEPNLSNGVAQACLNSGVAGQNISRSIHHGTPQFAHLHTAIGLHNLQLGCNSCMAALEQRHRDVLIRNWFQETLLKTPRQFCSCTILLHSSDLVFSGRISTSCKTVFNTLLPYCISNSQASSRRDIRRRNL